MSPEIQNRGTSGPKKGHVSAKNFNIKKTVVGESTANLKVQALPGTDSANIIIRLIRFINNVELLSLLIQYCDDNTDSSKPTIMF